MRLAPVLFGALCGLAAAPLACGLDRAGLQPPPDQVTATGGYGGTGAGGTGAGATGAGGTGAGGTGAGGTGGQPVACGGGYECVAAPAGATHVVNAAGSCPSGWDTPHPLYEDTSPGCSTCSCVASAGTCSQGTVYRYDDTECGTAKDTHQPSDDECVDVDEASDGQQADSYYLEVAPDEVGCPATVAQPDDLAIHDTCGISSPSAGACDAGDACVPVVGPTEQLCVLLSGDVSCPSGFTNPRSFYDGMSDSRSCQCDCSAPTGSSCDGAFVRLYDDNDCGGGSTEPLWADICWDAGGVNWHDSFELEAGTYQAGSCTPVDQHTGQVDFSDPVTLCCEP